MVSCFEMEGRHFYKYSLDFNVELMPLPVNTSAA